MALKAEVMMSIIIEILVTRPLLAQFTYSTLILLDGRVYDKRELTVYFRVDVNAENGI